MSKKQPSDMSKKPKMTKIAALDAAGVYQGLREIPETDLKPGDVHLPAGCDLPAGHYRWDADKKTFIPLRPDRQKMKEQPPQALNAIAIGFIAAFEQGVKLPPETLTWIDSYVQTMDFRAPYSDETVAMTERFKRRNG